MPKQKRKSETFSVHRAADWPALTELVSMAEQTLSPDSGEGLWFRGTTDQSFKLAPTLMREPTVFQEPSTTRSNRICSLSFRQNHTSFDREI